MVDGVPWTASAASVASAVANPSAGTYTITLSQTGSSASTIVLTLTNIGKADTFYLGVGPTNFGGQAQFIQGASTWSTPNSGDDGQIQITTLTSTVIGGNFNFDATAKSGGATGTKHVTGGQFNLSINGTGAGAGDALGKSLSMTVDTLFWNAATADGALTNGIFVANASGTMDGVGAVTMTLNAICAAGDYPLSASGNVRTISISDLSGTKVWSSSGTGGGGTVTIGTVKPTLIKGSFTNVTLVPVFGGATGTRTLVGGSFTLGQTTPPTCGTER